MNLYRVTKKAVQRRLGSKEDECIVSSDAELDAKIELFKSISQSISHLYRIVDHYQERLCILAQEENALGKFLKETGKNSNTTGKMMLTTGKAISYCGQQRMTICPPLLRLHHEVETFRGRAVADTHATIMSMERERTEYRAALSWMKSASNQLDPDTGRGLEKFRKAQTHVRLAKAKFDRLSLDCLQKIDLLAAARCNMFSHALVTYMSALLHFATKSSETFKATSKALSTSPQYNFCILKDLSQSNPNPECNEEMGKTDDNVQPIDSDQMLFFLDEYKDEKVENKDITKTQNIVDNQNVDNTALVDISLTSQSNEETVEQTLNLMNNLLDEDSNTKISVATIEEQSNNEMTESIGNLLNFDDFLMGQDNITELMSSQLLLGENQNITDCAKLKNNSTNLIETKNRNSLLDFFNSVPLNKTTMNNVNAGTSGEKSTTNNTLSQVKLNNKKHGRQDMSAWFHLFSELDPLANPDVMARKIDGGKDNSQAA